MPVITVSQLNNYMKRYIERNVHLSDLWIKGEISNFKKHYSGHIYMTLKDEESSLKAVMFKSYADKLKFIPGDGSKVIAFGKIDVFERDGVYQLYAESLIPDGVGELYAAYEKLKEQLVLEGLFDRSYKKQLPPYPENIGIITSISGAALRDIMNVISRRYRLADICIYPVKVQGIGASDSICQALNYFSEKQDCDVVILSRGGGSIEDLWAFNEEKTARAIFACKKPVISGVGHETDYTISDFVADMRAPTPSAAAELAVPLQDDIEKSLINTDKYIYNLLYSRIDALSEILSKMGVVGLTDKVFVQLEMKKMHLEALQMKMLNSFNNISADTLKKLAALSASLDAMDPKKVLKRGYSMVADIHDKAINISNIKKNDKIKVVFDTGYAKCDVLEVIYEKRN